ncbi:MAG: DUF2249 domain-containing protein [Rhodocyclaceae bacterium]|nr:DUF2249 domain-containing protein [Rhodocyclaceae bacterium]
MTRQHLLDVRWQSPPLPFEMALDALDELSDADELVLLIHREPGPLYAYLVQNGFAYRTEAVDDGTFRILIRREAS